MCCCAVWGITAAVKNRLGSLLGLEVLGTSVEQSPSNVEQNYAYDVVQSSCGDRGNDLPCDEYANAAADEVAQGGNGVVTTLLDEYERVSGHQQSAGTHEDGEAYAGGAAEKQAGCHAGSIQTEADVHEGAPYYVQQNCYPELPLIYSKASSLTHGTEGADAGSTHEYDYGSAQHGDTKAKTDLVNVPLGDDLCESISADHGGYAHSYQEYGFALYAPDEDQGLEDNGEGITDIQSAGDVDVINVVEYLVKEGRGSKGTYAEGIQEVAQHANKHALCPLLAASSLEVALVVLVDVNDQHASDAYKTDSQYNLKSQYH